MQWVRARVRAETLRHVRPGQTLLELNAGTGLDSAFFAELGVLVTATDNAPGMLEQLHQKQRPTLPLEVRALSYLELDALAPQQFDHAFSNFGGLNCTDRLPDVLAGLSRRLKPGGTATLVIMPRIAPWDLVEVLRGRFGLAGRRLGKGPAMATVEGVQFPCWYYPASTLRMPGCEVIGGMALSLLVPPPHHAAFAGRYPRATRALERAEDRVCRLPGVRGWGDHYVITFRARDR